MARRPARRQPEVRGSTVGPGVTRRPAPSPACYYAPRAPWSSLAAALARAADESSTRPQHLQKGAGDPPPGWTTSCRRSRGRTRPQPAPTLAPVTRGVGSSSGRPGRRSDRAKWRVPRGGWRFHPHVPPAPEGSANGPPSANSVRGCGSSQGPVCRRGCARSRAISTGTPGPRVHPGERCAAPRKAQCQRDAAGVDTQRARASVRVPSAAAVPTFRPARKRTRPTGRRR